MNRKRINALWTTVYAQGYHYPNKINFPELEEINQYMKKNSRIFGKITRLEDKHDITLQYAKLSLDRALKRHVNLRELISKYD